MGVNDVSEAWRSELWTECCAQNLMFGIELRYCQACTREGRHPCRKYGAQIRSRWRMWKDVDLGCLGRQHWGDPEAFTCSFFFIPVHHRSSLWKLTFCTWKSPQWKFEKEHQLPSTLIFVFHDSFCGCSAKTSNPMWIRATQTVLQADCMESLGNKKQPDNLTNGWGSFRWYEKRLGNKNWDEKNDPD